MRTSILTLCLLFWPTLVFSQIVVDPDTGAGKTEVISKTSKSGDIESSIISIPVEARDGSVMVLTQLDLVNDLGKEFSIELWVDRGKGLVFDTAAGVLVGALGKDGKPATQTGFLVPGIESAEKQIVVKIIPKNKAELINAGATLEIVPDAKLLADKKAAQKARLNVR